MEKRNANATENAARAKRVKQAKAESVPTARSITPDRIEDGVPVARSMTSDQTGDGEDWTIVVTYTVGVMKTIDGRSVSKEEAIEIAAEELREAKPKDFDFEVS